jgi:hypothetical protein
MMCIIVRPTFIALVATTGAREMYAIGKDSQKSGVNIETIRHDFVFAGAHDRYAVLAHQTPDTTVAHVQADLS